MFFTKKPDPRIEQVEPTFPQSPPYSEPRPAHLVGLPGIDPQPTTDELRKQIDHLTRIAVRTETRLCQLIERMGIKGIVN